MRKSVAWVAAAVGVVAVALGAPAPASAAPVEEVASRYIVRTDSPSVTDAVVADVQRDGGDVENVYTSVLPGLAATLTPTQADELAEHRDVTSVTPDQVFHATSVQTGADWDLDRIDQRATRASSTYAYDTTGAGVTAFVIDSGIRGTHRQFGGRVVSGPDFVDGDRTSGDCKGHGTHVAGTIGGTTYGVAKAVKLVAVRVLDCNGAGYASDIIDALDWVTAHKPAGPAVVNLSLGGDAFPLLDQAVTRTIAAGIPVVVAAGNSSHDACTESPARVPAAITVAATTSSDTRPSWSNAGRCVDLFAPGSSIRSAGIASDTATAVLSGTSMATPHVTGAVARYLQGHPGATPAQTAAALVATATTGTVHDASGAPDRLLYVAAPATVPGVATKVAATKDDRARQETLRWAAPATDGGRAVTAYRVTRNGRDSAGHGSTTVTVAAGTRSHTFTKLRTGARYTLTVTAVNAVGGGARVSRTLATLG